MTSSDIHNLIERVHNSGTSETIDGYQVQKIDDVIVIRNVDAGFDMFTEPKEIAVERLIELMD